MKLRNEDKILIEKAKETILKRKTLKLEDTGDVASALITSMGNIFYGISLGFYCGLGSCAEYQAIGSMISNGEKEIKTIVAIRFEKKNKQYEIIHPCGKCREMMHQLGLKNSNTEVIISKNKKVKLKELLPYSYDGTIEKKY